MKIILFLHGVRISGQGAAYLVIVAQYWQFFGLIPAGAFVPLFILGGVILFPVFTFGISVAFSSSKIKNKKGPVQLVLF